MYKKYRIIFLSFSLVACLLIGFFILFSSVEQLHRSVLTHEKQRMEIATTWIEDQMETLKEIGYQITVTACYKPVYFEHNSLYAQKMMEDLSKYQRYSPIIGNIKLLYKADPDYVFGVKYKSSFDVYARNILEVSNVQQFHEQLMSVLDQTIFYPPGLNRTFCVAQKLAINGHADPSGDAVLIFTVSLDEFLMMIQRVSGLDVERIAELSWKEKPILNNQFHGNTLKTSGENVNLTMGMRGAFSNSEILDLCITGLYVILGAMLILAVMALFAARHSYKPIAQLAERFDLKPEAEFQQIEHMLMNLHNFNTSSQQKIADLITQLQSQNRKIRSHLLLLLLNGNNVEITTEQMKNAGLNMKHTLYCAIAFQLNENQTDEEQIVQYIESISDKHVSFFTVRISHQGHFAVVINASDAYTILSQKEILQDVLASISITTSISIGEVVRKRAKLSYSLQTALYGLYQGEQADLSMFGSGRVQQMLELIENGSSQEAKLLFVDLCQLVTQSYPLRAMQQNILLQIVDKVNALALRKGMQENGSALRRVLMLGDFEQFSQQVQRQIDLIAEVATEQRDEKSNREARLAEDLLAYIRANACDSQFGQEMAAEHFDITERQVGRLVKAATDVSYKDYVINVKIDFAKKLLAQNLSVTETCMRIGYTNIPHFIKMFKERTGVTPGNWKNFQQQGDEEHV